MNGRNNKVKDSDGVPAKISEVLIQRLMETGLSTRRFLKVDGKAAVEKDWPNRLYGPEELKGHERNYGVCAGEGLVLVDGDEEPLLSRLKSFLPETFTVISPGHGAPHYYLHIVGEPENLTLFWGKDEKGQPRNVGHVQARNKYLVGPGSIHPLGGKYYIAKDAAIAQVSWTELQGAVAPFLLETQEAAVRDTTQERKHARDFDLDIMAVLPAGLKQQGEELYGPHPVHGSTTGHNFWVNPKNGTWHCFRCNSGGGAWSFLAVLEGIIDCVDAKRGALRGERFKRVLEAAKRRGLIKEIPSAKTNREEGGDKKRESQASSLVKLAIEASITLFHDERKEPYIRIRRDEVLVNLRLRSKDAKTWLSGLFWREREKAPSNEALSSALNVLEAKANEGEEYRLYNRVAPAGEDGSLWLDLCDEECRAVHVTRAGWEVVNHPPILFRRFSHQQSIPVPVQGGSLVPILDYANITHLGDQLLYVVAAVTYLIPSIPHVVMILFGVQGSGKTWALRVIRALIDPSQLDLLSLPTRYPELVQNLDHNWCAFYDNVGRLPPWQSNVFCRAVTGEGVSKRQLYTNDEDVIYQYHRCVGLTDINIAAERGDLLQRSLLLGLYAIPKEYRKTESELRAKLIQDQPKVLGGILDVLVKAMNLYPTINRQSLHRMADFVVWGRAITEALGIKSRHFDEAYEENIDAQNLEAVHASPISDTLIRLMESYPLGWSGTVSQLYSELEAQAKELKISTRQKDWPKKPNVLSRVLNELAPSLPVVGLKIERGYREKTRIILINIIGIVGIDGNAERQVDWGKGRDLRKYLGDSTADTDDSAGISESFSGRQPERPAPVKVPLGDLIPKLREMWPGGCQRDCEDWVVRLGRYGREEAVRIFEEHLAGKLVFLDPGGRWEWVRKADAPALGQFPDSPRSGGAASGVESPRRTCAVCGKPIEVNEKWTCYRGQDVHLGACYHTASEEAV